MGNTSDFKNGLIIEHKNGLYKIVEFLHVKPGKGGAFVRTKLKNIKTGQVIDETFRSGANVTAVRVEARNYNFLYKSNEKFKSIYPDFKFMNLKDGLEYTYAWFCANYKTIRQ